MTFWYSCIDGPHRGHAYPYMTNAGIRAQQLGPFLPDTVLLLGLLAAYKGRFLTKMLCSEPLSNSIVDWFADHFSAMKAPCEFMQPFLPQNPSLENIPWLPLTVDGLVLAVVQALWYSLAHISAKVLTSICEVKKQVSPSSVFRTIFSYRLSLLFMTREAPLQAG